MQEITITKANHTDLQTLIELGKKTFFETYAQRNSEADMKAYLTDNFNDKIINGQLENPNSEFYIAWDDEQPIGYLKVNEGAAQTDLKEEGSLEIERIYVLASYHGKGIGHLLYEKATEIAKRKNKTSIWLGVWEENPRAIRFYEKNGFKTFAQHLFIVGSEEQTDHLMRKLL